MAFLPSLTHGCHISELSIAHESLKMNRFASFYLFFCNFAMVINNNESFYTT